MITYLNIGMRIIYILISWPVEVDKERSHTR
jgi:hypothetical protein